jgi:hypothetical protein
VLQTSGAFSAVTRGPRPKMLQTGLFLMGRREFSRKNYRFSVLGPQVSIKTASPACERYARKVTDFNTVFPIKRI